MQIFIHQIHLPILGWSFGFQLFGFSTAVGLATLRGNGSSIHILAYLTLVSQIKNIVTNQANTCMNDWISF